MRNRPVLTFLSVAVLALALAHLLDRAAYTWLYDPSIYDRDWGRMLRTMGFLPFWLLGAVVLWLHDRGVPPPGDASAPTSGPVSTAGRAPTSGPAPASAAPAPHDAPAPTPEPTTMPGLVSTAGPAETSGRGRSPLADGGARGPGRRAYARALLLALAPTLSGIAGELLKLLIRRERPWAAGGAYVFRPFSDRPLYGGGLAMPSSHAVVAFGAAFALARLFPRTAPVWYLVAAGCALTRVAVRAHFLSDVTLGALVAWAVVAGVWRWWLGRAGRANPPPQIAARP